MTKNQRLVLVWLKENSSQSGVIRCSNSRIAEVFGWSQPYAQKILSNMVSMGYLAELLKGAGHRPTKYKVLSPRDNLSSHNNPLPLPLGRGNKTSKREGVFGSARIRVANDEGSLPLPQSRRVNRDGPMKKFREKWDQVSKWGPTDIVCYYRWLYHTRFGEMPEVDWSICCGTARSLMKRLGSSKSVKRYLQIAFSIIRFKPQGLNSLYHSTLYEQVRQHWEDDEDLWDDYHDDWVFPWCKQKMLERSREMNRVYMQHLWDVSRTPEHQARMEKQRQERLHKVMFQNMKDNWELYSEVRR